MMKHFLILCSLTVSGVNVFGAAMEPLTVKGRDVVTRSGKVVSMRGMNFGGWLMMETWIPSIEMEWHDRLPR
ncbi:MAG TPA: hypothetical protein EYG38_06835, partial [Verrucomicrobia bacterium]|nr:hypothetical protein [Verrucomicrobiota bacterium]